MFMLELEDEASSLTLSLKSDLFGQCGIPQARVSTFEPFDATLGPPHCAICGLALDWEIDLESLCIFFGKIKNTKHFSEDNKLVTQLSLHPFNHVVLNGKG